jgi:hypothetical protein
METTESPTPRANFITGVLLGLLFLGLAGMFAWMYYQVYVSKTGKVGYIDERNRFYIKDLGTVVSKEVKDGTYNLNFPYPEKHGSYQGVKQVSQSEYEESQQGDKFSIYYNPSDPGKWLLPNRGTLGWGAVALLVVFSSTFLFGTWVMIQTVRTFLLAGNLRAEVISRIRS